MFSTEKTKQYWKVSRHSWTLEKSLRASSLPFLSTLVRWTTLARLDFGIVAVGEGVVSVVGLENSFDSYAVEKMEYFGR